MTFLKSCFIAVLLTVNRFHFVKAKDNTNSLNLILDFCHPLHQDDGTDLEVLNARDIDSIKGKLRLLISDDESGCLFPIRQDFIAVFVRLAWHDIATWDCHSQTGGAHARMRFSENPENPYNDLDNKGLERYIEYLDIIHDVYADRISRADLWALAALTAIEYGSGLSIPFRWGRTDEQNATTGYTGRLPSAYMADENGEPDERALFDHLISLFERLEFEDPLKALVVLSGAHNMGGPRPEHTQMTPAFKVEPIPWTPIGKFFHNAFYSELLWAQWWPTDAEREDTRVLLHADNRTIMFYSDFSLLQTQRAVDLVHLYATDLNAWLVDFAEMFSFLLERGYPEGTLKDVETTYLWERGEYERCSEPCGGGLTTRTVNCVSYPDMKIVDSDLCLTSRDAKKEGNIGEVKHCNDQPCMDYAWYYDEWIECDRICGSGIQTREVYCIRVDTKEVVEDDNCRLLNPPSSLQSCNTEECGIWQPIVGSEGECDMPCENSWLSVSFAITADLWTGQSTAEMQCMKDYDGNLRIVDDSYCDTFMKPDYIKCIKRFCDQTLPHWRASQWDKCSADCYGGIQTREVTCWLNSHNLTADFAEQIPDESCLNPPASGPEAIHNVYIPPIPLPEMPSQWGPKPITERTCNVKDCQLNTLIRTEGGISASPGLSDKTSGSAVESSGNDGIIIIVIGVVLLAVIGMILLAYKVYKRQSRKHAHDGTTSLKMVSRPARTPLLVEENVTKGNLKEESYQTFNH